MRSWKSLVVALLATLLVASTAQAAEPLIYLRTTFDQNRNSQGDALMRSDTSGTFENAIPLSFSDCGWLGRPCHLADPAVSSDGRKIVFGHGPDLWTVNSDGSGLTQITQARRGVNYTSCSGVCDNQPLEVFREAEFSPDGTKLIMMWQDVTRLYGPTRIEEISVSGANRRTVIGWNGVWSPEYSPSGNQIAFTAYSDPQGSNLNGATLWVANVDGSAPRQLTSRPPGVGGPEALNPAWSPGGDVIAFDDGSGSGELWTVRLDGTGKAQIPSSSVEPLRKYKPTWSPDGTTIAYTTSREIHTMNPSGIGDRRLFAADSSHRKDHAMRQLKGTFTPFVPSDAQVIAQYKPEIRYDIFESYRADNPGVLTDSYTLGTGAHYNTLMRSSGAVLAVSDPANRADDLKLSYLAPIYPGKKPTSAVASDLIDAAGSSNDFYAADASRMHANPAYANQVTGRAVSYPDGSRVLQYWLFYYNNPKTYFTRGAHEGDWEMVQVHLDSVGDPVRATYSQHGGGERCEWINVQRNGNGQPIVYVAEGSHASYFSAGYHFNEGADDTSGGNGEVVASPRVVDVTTNAPSWLSWPGRWGGTPSATLGSESPPGPKFQSDSKWSDPLTWSNSVDGCTEGQTQAPKRAPRKPQVRRAPAAPAKPQISATRTRGRVTIRIRAADVSADRWRDPYVALTSVSSSGRRVPPLTRHTLIDGGSLVVRQAVPRGSGPYTVRVALSSRRGSRGPTAAVRVP